MRGALLTAMAAGLLAACSGGAVPVGESAEAREVGVLTIAPKALSTRIEAGEKIQLIDVRTPEEFAEGRLPGALNAPVETFDAASIPVEEERETILYCRSGNRSARAAQMLADETGGTVRHLEGGIVAWEEAGREMFTSPEG